MKMMIVTGATILIKDETICIKSISRVVRFDVTIASYHDNEYL